MRAVHAKSEVRLVLLRSISLFFFFFIVVSVVFTNALLSIGCW